MADLNSLRTLSDFLDHSAMAFPDKVGLVFEDKEYIYKELRKKANDISFLVSEKTRKGDVVALLLPNTPELIFSYFGILGAGRTVLFLPANISDKSLVFQVEKTSPKYIISEQKYLSKLQRTGLSENLEFIDAKEITEASEFVFNQDVNEKDVSTIIFTSGTTGEPKGVKLQHFNVVNATKNIIEFLKWNEKDVDVNILSLSHSFGIGNIHSVFAVSATTVLFRDAINLKKIVQTIDDKKATTFAAVPATLRLIVDNYYENFKKRKSLRFVQTNTSPLDEKFIRKIISMISPADFNYYYGLSEASRSTFINLSKHTDKITSVGQPSPNVEIKILDYQDKELPIGEIGEVCIKGKHVIKEYWENPEASKKIRNGFLHTGDAGYLDKDGFLYFKGRKDDIINVSGEKVAPEEVEEVVRRVPGVLDAVAIGAQDKLLGQAIKVFVRVKNNSFDTEEVIKECRKNLESYKVPRSVEIVSEIPRTENGKLRRIVFKNNH